MRHLSTLLILLSINISLMAQSVGVNLADGTTANTMLDVNGSVSFREGTALTCANGVNSNIALANYSFYRVTGPTAAFSITGFGNGTDGRCLTIINASGQTMTLSHLTTSTTGNQINTGGSAVVLSANGVATLMYNANLTKWIVSGTMGTAPSFTSISNGSFSDSMIVINGGVPFKVRPVDYIETYAWGLDGNAGTVDGTNFLGTTDNIPLSIRVNNQKAGRIDHLLNNAFWGYQAGNAITSGTNNVAIGSTALSTMTTGNENVAIGGQSAFSNTTGVRNVSIGYQSARNGTHSNSVMIGYQAGLQNAASNNVFIGSLSGPFTSTGSDNIGMGYYTLFNNQTGKNNVAIGTFALSTTTAAWGNTAVGYLSSASIQTGQANTAVGDSSLMNNVLGSNNTHLGYRAGLWTTGSNNIAIGHNAALPVSTADNQLALGTWLYGKTGFLGINTIDPQYKLDIDAKTGSTGNPLRLQGLQAGLTSDSIVSSNGGILRRLSIAQVVGSGAWSTTGNASTVDGTNFLGTTDNIPLSIRVNNLRSGYIGTSNENAYFGYRAGSVVTGTGNTFMGHQSGRLNTSGESNTAVGASTMGVNVGGKDNVAIGYYALAANTSGDDNTAVGKLAMTSNTSGQHNVAVGEAALQLNTTGVQNTALGREALYGNTTGRDNTALGYNALRANTTSDRNIAIGKNALITQSFNNGGSAYNAQNVAIGYEALSVNQPTSSSNGINNTAVGYQSGKANTTGTNNTFIGNYAAEANTTGSNNVALGYQAGNVLTTGSNNTLLGYQANVGSNALTNATAIGNGASVSASNKVRIGNASITVIEGQVAYSFPSDRRLKKDITDNKLGLVFIKDLRPVHYALKSDSTNKVHDGFIAQDIEATMNKLGVTFSGLNKPQTEKDNYSVAYSTFVIPLVNAVKELDAKVEALTKENTALKAKVTELDALKAEVEKIKKAIGIDASAKK